jgi:hypothetical protein
VTLATLYPSAVHDQIAAYIATINGLMGNFHDGLMSAKLDGRMDYYKDRFVLQEEVRTRLACLVKAIVPTPMTIS